MFGLEAEAFRVNVCDAGFELSKYADVVARGNRRSIVVGGGNRHRDIG
jgi:hypothetical protein